MDDKTLHVLSVKLDAIIKLMVFGMTEGKSQTEQIRLLSAAGFQPKDIAETLGTTPNTVSVVLSNLRKAKTKTSGRRAGANDEP
jgi:DNA-binding CsgD family transcriptional regulator